ncbi:ATP-dependent DNA ligase [Candidatus Woesearchaeota archaeon]|nr:ATP-dependent DNA ligase [Candidatus Woesearchaeota archaeon]
MDYEVLVQAYEKLEATTKRLEKTSILSDLLKKTDRKDLSMGCYLLQGLVFPKWDERKLGMSSMLILKTLQRATGTLKAKIENIWRKEGDLGKVAEILIKENKQQTLIQKKLTIEKVFETLQKLASLEGQGTVGRKVSLVAGLLTQANPKEAKFIVKTVLQELRVGTAEGTMRDAIVWAFLYKDIDYDRQANQLSAKREEYERKITCVQSAYDITSDFSKVAQIARESGEEGLKEIRLEIGKPFKVMLYQKAQDISDAFKTVGRPAAIEFKYDGIRLQIEKKKDKVILFTRRLEDVTRQFPDVVEAVNKSVKADEAILDAEAVGYDQKKGKYLPFQFISQRIKRKYNIEDMARKFPVEVNVFDIIYYNGKSLLSEKFENRRSILRKIINEKEKSIVLAKQLVTTDEKKAAAFYKKALMAGNEGIMFKKLDAAYRPGSRVGYGVKLKEISEEVDVVVVAAEWGEGKRSAWLSSFTVACKDGDKYSPIGKVSTGIKEKTEGVTYEKMTKLLKKQITSQKGKVVAINPEVVIEVGYEEIQKSPTYASGFALRFPRVLRLRQDKAPKEAITLEEIKTLFAKQKK